MKQLSMNYVFSLAVLFGAAVLYDKYKSKLKTNEDMDQYDIVKKFLLKGERNISLSFSILIDAPVYSAILSTTLTSHGLANISSTSIFN